MYQISNAEIKDKDLTLPLRLREISDKCKDKSD